MQAFRPEAFGYPHKHKIMKKLGLGISFWTIYTLGFTVVLPTVLYYNIDSMESSPEQSATMAFIYLGLGIIIWLAIILWYSRFFIKLVFTDKQRLEKTATEGITIVAKITGKTQAGTERDTAVLNLKLAFNNLAGTAVEIPYQLNDGKPYENRFEVGNTIEMRASLDGDNSTFVPKTMQVVRNKGIVFFCSFIFLFLIMAAIVYPVFSYQQESQGAGWRFLSLLHPWIMVPLINLAVGAFIWFIISFIGKASGSSTHPLRMVLHGIKTTGTILSYGQTGMYINEQPQVQFEIEYTDQRGIRRTILYKKIVSLLDIHKIATGSKEIMYEDTQSQNIIFYEDLTL
jgi:predicted permease